jgi:glycosyltransferase involved in cell wall biosynthesis
VYEGGRLRMLAYRISDRLADRTTAVSSAVAVRFVHLKAVPKDKCVILTNGIEIAEFSPDPQRRAAMRAEMGVGEEFVWLSVGRITAAKDLPNLMQAFGNVRHLEARTELWIAGEAPSARGKNLVLIPMPQGAIEHVRRLGLRHDIPALLNAADGFVLGSAWEGMPLAVGEAMAMEKPVIATDVGGLRELVGEAGVLLPAKDPQALARAMLAVMERPVDERAALGRAARLRILQHFSMEAKVDEWEALYRAVMISVTRGPESPVVP